LAGLQQAFYYWRLLGHRRGETYFEFCVLKAYKKCDLSATQSNTTKMEEGRKQSQVKTLRIASRSKRIDGVIHEPGVVMLSISNLERHFSSPLHVAAKDLGVCTTALKR
jgi:hypothetical protein